VPGSVQSFELQSITVGGAIERSAEFEVAADGSFTAEVTVPTDIRIGRATLIAVPPVRHYCSDDTADDCILPRILLTVGHAADDLTPVTIVRSEVDTPPLPDHGALDPFAFPGPAQGQLTLVIYGSSCPTLPDAYVNNAPAKSLEIVTKVHIPANAGGCAELAKPWTTVIEIPDEYGDFDTVKVDNVEATIVGTAH